MKAVKMILSTHMDSGLMYRLYQNQDQWSITLRATYLDMLYNFAINEILCHTFLKNFKGCKAETWYTHRQ